jgi:hypothetical protein
MLLRRVIEHVREQNWTAVGIDFVIVVIGVFVGIQVSNWNAEREARQRGAGFSERLRADLHVERGFYAYMSDYYGAVRDAAEAAVDALIGAAPLSNHDLLVNAYRATQYRDSLRRRSTYDELVSTGNLGLIEDTELLGIAGRAYQLAVLDNLSREGRESRYREAFRMLIANDVQRELARRCGDRSVRRADWDGVAAEIGYPCTLELPVAQVDAAAEALRAAPELVRYLRLRIADLETRRADLARNRALVFGELREDRGEKP